MKANFKNYSNVKGLVRLVYLFICLLAVITVYSCKGPSAGGKKSAKTAPAANDEYFQEIAQQIGLDFVHSIGEEHMENIIQSVGGGGAFIDYDKDGFMDVFICSGTWQKSLCHDPKPEVLPHNHLYHNLGNGTFEDVTEKAGLSEPFYSMGVTVGDFNNDGYPDIYVSNYGANVLFKNNGNGTFSDVTKKAKVAGGEGICSVGAAWFDYDNDGLLDLYVGNYLSFDPDYKYFYAPDGFPGPMAYDAQPDVLYHNLGDGVFEDVTEKMGIKDPDGRAMGVGVIDYDNDGWVDVYVANDHTLNFLWHNDQGKGFTNKGTMSGTGFSQGGEATVSMSVDFADFNNDTLIDMFVSDDSYCSLYQNTGNGLFTEMGVTSGISSAAAQFVGWSSAFFDYDNDGFQDIYKGNGALKHLYGQEDQIFRNMGDGTFKDVSLELGSYFSKEMVGRGVCVGDYDNDGDEDVLVVNLNDPCVFLRNNKGSVANNWLTVDLTGTKSNRDAIGASVKIFSEGVTQYAQRKSTTGYLSQNDQRIHFGLGKRQKVDRIEIRWPSGKHQVIENVKPNQILKVTEP
jgi:enediyne biosynthesis protein E4